MEILRKKLYASLERLEGEDFILRFDLRRDGLSAVFGIMIRLQSFP